MCECERDLVAWMDGELEPAEAAVMGAHIESCAECIGRLRAYRQAGSDFAAYRDAVVARGVRAATRHRWVLAGALAASLLVAAALMRTSPEPPRRPHAVERPFIRIPYVPPLDPMERAAVVRIEMPAAALTAAGFHLGPIDPAFPVEADVVVGEDGRAHAVRVLNDMELR
ncbi:MAG TPA: zf-HC2 domain-containing protein [Candidatus Limnocylindrales bacterium]|nr:zf-HC2 domain-containing protein [Candidatus Limnocylindrales bacterium]